MLTIGLGGVTSHGCAALCDGVDILGVCEQERVTRVRQAGFNASGLPDEALNTLLDRLGYSRQSIDRWVIAEENPSLNYPTSRLDHHYAHASTAYLTSGFPSAAVLVCDQDDPGVSAWEGSGASIQRLDWKWSGPNPAHLYAERAGLSGLRSPGAEQRFEALARLYPDGSDASLDERGGDWVASIEEMVENGDDPLALRARAMAAATAQKQIGDVALSLLQDLRRRTSTAQLCLGGSLFYHTSICTLLKQSGLFDRVFVPLSPGNSGLAVGAALAGCGAEPTTVSPFMGPSYSSVEIKETLDNCKLQYAWEPDDAVIEATVEALRQGRLVGWFDGGMEWGPRALGGRSILASPFSPYVLENLNRFLKRRERWRGYAISGLEEAVAEHFWGPHDAYYMECDYRPRDAAQFRHLLPSPQAALRVHTVGQAAPKRFRRLLEAFGAATGMPFLVNTSFNGFQEPIVCNPRDAIRVFYGSGLDMLVIEQFVLRK